MLRLGKFAGEEAGTPTVGLTHLQPATLTTVGKRACLWLQELLMATKDILHFRKNMRLRGIQGPTLRPGPTPCPWERFEVRRALEPPSFSLRVETRTRFAFSTIGSSSSPTGKINGSVPYRPARA